MAGTEQMKGFRALTSEDTRLGSQPELPARFVDANKDELGAHVVRARLVVCETGGLSRWLSISDTVSAIVSTQSRRTAGLPAEQNHADEEEMASCFCC